MILPLYHGLSSWTAKRLHVALAPIRKHLPHDMDETRDTDTVACLCETAMRQAVAGLQTGRCAVLGTPGGGGGR